MNVLKELLRLWRDGEIPCVFHEITGLYCPGCGGTRAVKALLLGEIRLSFFYHPLVLYCAVVAAWFSVSYFLYWRTKDLKYRLYLDTKFVYAGIAIIVINFVLKNYFLLARGTDILELLPKV